MRVAIILFLAGSFSQFAKEFRRAEPADRPEILANLTEEVGEWTEGDRRDLARMLLKIVRDPRRKMLHASCLAPLIATGSESGAGTVLRLAYERDSSPLRAVARAAIAAPAGPDSTAVLGKFLHLERSPRARGILALLLGKRADRAAGPWLLPLLEDPACSVRAAAAEALSRIYLVCRGYDAAAWKLVVENPPAPVPEAPPSAEPGETRAETPKVRTPDEAAAELVPRFFDIPLDGSSVTVVLDFSRSMRGTGGDRIRKALADSLALLPTTRRFTLIAFDDRLLTLFGEPESADPDRKESLAKFLDDLPSGRRTELVLPLRAGLSIAANKGGAAPRLLVITDGGQNLEGPPFADLVERARLFAKAGGRIDAAVPGGRVVGLLRFLATLTGGSYATLPDTR